MQSDNNVGSASLTVAQGFTNAGTIDLTQINGANPDTATLAVTAGTLVNAGTITSSVGTGGLRTLTAQVTNQGTIAVNQALTLTNTSFTFDDTAGAISPAAGQTLSISSGTTLLGSATTLTGTGTVDLGGTATLGVNSDLTLLAAGAALTFSGTVTVNGPGKLINQASLTLSGDTVNTPLVNQGTLLVVAGTGSAINGALSNAAGGTLRVQSDNNAGLATLTVAQGFTNAGTIDLTQINGGNPDTAALTVTAGTLVNTGTISSSVGTGGNRTLTAQLDNQAAGTLTINQPLTISKGSAQDTNEGTINVAGGNLTVSQSGTSPSFTNTGTVTVASGLTLAVNGSNYTQTAGSTTLQGGLFPRRVWSTSRAAASSVQA